MVTGYHTVTNLAASEDDRIGLVYREHSGLSTVVSGDAIRAVIASEPFQRQLDSIRDKLVADPPP